MCRRLDIWRKVEEPQKHPGVGKSQGVGGRVLLSGGQALPDRSQQGAWYEGFANGGWLKGS